MSCLACGRGFHDECEQQPCCCSNNIDGANSTTTVGDNETIQEDSRIKRTVPKALKESVTISAGRKRAAREYEIDESVPCDWRGKANCGGGFIPVVGCLAGFQTARHHGPDKTTTNNSPENVHLICAPCHNLWHRRNDPKYGPDDKCPEGIQRHEPRWATLEELMTREVS